MVPFERIGKVLMLEMFLSFLVILLQAEARGAVLISAVMNVDSG